MSKAKSYITAQIVFLKNRYVYISILFLIWIITIDDTSLIQQAKRSEELANLQKRKKAYIEENNMLKSNIQKVDNDMDFLEQFARETYRMKKEDEDIFIFSDKQK